LYFEINIGFKGHLTTSAEVGLWQSERWSREQGITSFVADKSEIWVFGKLGN